MGVQVGLSRRSRRAAAAIPRDVVGRLGAKQASPAEAPNGLTEAADIADGRSKWTRRRSLWTVTPKDSKLKTKKLGRAVDVPSCSPEVVFSIDPQR